MSVISTVLAGFLTSLLAAAVFVGTQRCSEAWRLRHRLHPLEGLYDGYGCTGDGDYVLKPEPQSWARIDYVKANRLSIVVRHGQSQWRGVVLMSKEYEHIGQIAWSYENLPENVRLIGFKRLIADRRRDEIYLIGETEHGYGHEILMRANPGSTNPHAPGDE